MTIEQHYRLGIWSTTVKSTVFEFSHISESEADLYGTSLLCEVQYGKSIYGASFLLDLTILNIFKSLTLIRKKIVRVVILLQRRDIICSRLADSASRISFVTR